MAQYADQCGDDYDSTAYQRPLQQGETILEALKAPVYLFEALVYLLKAPVYLLKASVETRRKVVDLRPKGVQSGVCCSGLHCVLYCCIVNISASLRVIGVGDIVRGA